MKEERADAERVSSQEKAALAFVVEGDGELSLEVIHQAAAMLFPQVNQDLGIGVATEVMAPPLKVRAKLVMIENFAVEDDHDSTVLVSNRLAASFEIDNGKSATVEGYLRF